MKNQQIADIFNRIALLLELRDDNPFKIRAYRRAALNIENLTDSIEEIARKDQLEEIPGIGKDLALKIKEFIATGKVHHQEELQKKIPEGMVALIGVPGIGPKTAKQLYDAFKVTSLKELERLAKTHKIAGLPGIKEKTEENILRGIEFSKKGTDRRPLGVVLPVAEEVLSYLRKLKEVQKVEIAGSLRRRRETVRDIDILTTSSNPKKVMEVFIGLPGVKEVLSHGETRSSVTLEQGIQMDLRVVEPESYGAALAYFTGSKAHNIRLRELGVRKGLKINEYGIFEVKTDKRIGGAEEEDIYRILGLPYIPPELREDTGEVEAAMEGRLPHLVELSDIRGDFHVHTRQSDGNNTILEMALAAKRAGREYIVITDHTKSLGIARGLNEEALLAQKKEIAEVNRELKGFTVLHGAEVNILSDGTIDIEEAVLAQLDFVVASIHSGFMQSREQLTRRAVKALQNPNVDVLAHPTGRLLGEREGYDIDLDQVIKAAKKAGKALEINAYPVRLDLTDISSKKAKEAGVKLVIATDSHQTDQLRFMEYGVGVARRGWLEKKDLLNCLTVKELQKELNKH